MHDHRERSLASNAGADYRTEGTLLAGNSAMAEALHARASRLRLKRKARPKIAVAVRTIAGPDARSV